MAYEIINMIANVSSSGVATVRKDFQNLKKDVDSVKESMDDVNGTTVKTTVELNGADSVKNELSGIISTLTTVGRTPGKVTVEANTEGAKTELNSLFSMVVDKTLTIRADADTTAAETKLTDFMTRYGSTTRTLNITADADVTAAETAIGTLKTLLLSIPRNVTIDVRLNMGAIVPQLAALMTALAAIPRNIDIGVDLDIGAAVAELIALRAALGGVSGASGGATSGISGFGFAAVAMASALVLGAGLLTPLLGGLAAVGSLGFAAAGGLGLMGGAIYVLKEGLYDGGIAIDAMADKWSSLGDQMAVALGPASGSIAHVALELMDVAENYIPMLGQSATTTAAIMAETFGQFGAWLAPGNAGFEFMSNIIASIAPIMGLLSQAALAFGQGLIATFSAAAPFAVDLAAKIRDIAYQFSTWAQSAEGQEQITAAIEGAIPVFQTLWDIVTQVGGALLTFGLENGPAVADALSIIGDVIVWAVQGFTALMTALGPVGFVIAALAPIILGVITVIGTLIAGIMGIVSGAVALWPVIAAVGSAIAGVAAPILIAIGVITALAAAAYLIYTNWSTISTFFVTLWADVQTAFSSAWSSISSWLTSTMSSIVASIESAWTGVVSFFTSLGASILAALSAAWASIAAAVMGFVTPIVTSIITAWNGVVLFFTTLGTQILTALTTAFQAIAAVVLPVIIVAVALIVGAFALLITGLYNLGILIADTIIAWFSALGAVLMPVIQLVIDGIVLLWQGLVIALQAVWLLIQEAIILAWQTIQAIVMPVIQAFIDGIVLVWNGLVTALQVVWELISAAISAAWTGIQAVVVPVVQAIVDAIVATWNGIIALLQAVWDAVSSAITTAWTTIQSVVVPVVQAIVDAIVLTWETLSTTLSTVMTTIQTAIETGWTYIRDTVITPIMTAIQTTVQTIWDAISLAITTVMTTIQTAIETAWIYIRDTVITPILTAIQTTIETVWTYISEFVSTTLTTIQTAIETAWTFIQDTTTTAWDAVSTTITDVWTSISTFVSDTLTSIQDAIQTAWDAIVESASGFGTALYDALESAFTGAVNRGLDILAGLLQAIADGLSSIGGVAQPFADTAQGAADAILGYKFEDGGVVKHAAGGLGTKGRNARTHMWNEGLGNEAFIAERGPVGAQIAYLQEAASWFGLGVIRTNQLDDPFASTPGPRGTGRRFCAGGLSSGTHAHAQGGYVTGSCNCNEKGGAFGHFASGGLAMPVAAFQLGGTHYNWDAATAQIVSQLSGATGGCGVPNTYYGHAYIPGADESQSVDWWGGGGRGSQIDYGCGNSLFDAGQSMPGHTYSIWNGTHTGIGAFPEDPHYDHVHQTFAGSNGVFGFVCKAIKAAAQKAADVAKSAAKALLPDIDLDPVEGVAEWGIDEGIQAFVDWVIEQLPSCSGGGDMGSCGAALPAALQQLGLEGTAFESMMPGLISCESSGDPNAINDYDSNAAAGTPSIGCTQMIQPTFDAHKEPGCDDIYDPLCNLMASMNYQQSRYGGAVPGCPYLLGGVVPGRDGQGVPIWAHAGERVLTAGQNRAFESLLPIAEQLNRNPINIDTGGNFDGIGRNRIGRGAGGGAIVHVHQHFENMRVGHEYTLDELKDATREAGFEGAEDLVRDMAGGRIPVSGRIARGG